MDIGRKGGYNIAEVFGRNYLSILKKYITNGSLENSIYQDEKKKILFKHIIPYYFDSSNDFLKTGFFDHMQIFVKHFAPYLALITDFSELMPRTFLANINKLMLWGIFPGIVSTNIHY